VGDVEDFEDSEEDDDVAGINEVDTTLEEISGSTSNGVESVEPLVELEEVARSADVTSSVERLADSVVAGGEVNVLTSSITVLETSEKLAELVGNIDEFDVAGSAEIDVEVDEEDNEDVNDVILEIDEELDNTELEDIRSIAGANASSAVGLVAVTLFDEDKDVV
jgi:hypothetical protein